MLARILGHRERVSEGNGREGAPRGPLVELVRLVLVAALAVIGWRIADLTSEMESWLLFGIVMGSAVGYVLGGVLGRRTARAVSAVERDFEKVPASHLLAGTIGLILGLCIAVLVSLLLFRLFPPSAAARAAQRAPNFRRSTPPSVAARARAASAAG